VHADRIIKDAQFIADALPNVEEFSVEHTLRQLYAVHLVLANLNDPWLTRNEIGGFIDMVIRVALPLQQF
jgi:hypothetical protein